jgi:hypothetical protein
MFITLGNGSPFIRYVFFGPPAWVTTLALGPQNMEDLRGLPLSSAKIGFRKVQTKNNHLNIITLAPSSFCGFPFFPLIYLLV